MQEKKKERKKEEEPSKYAHLDESQIDICFSQNKKKKRKKIKTK